MHTHTVRIYAHVLHPCAHNHAQQGIMNHFLIIMKLFKLLIRFLRSAP